MNISGMPLVEYIYRRCLNSENTDLVSVITSTHTSDDELVQHCINSNIPVFRGPLDNVLKRYIQAAAHYELDSICRLCGDSPFVDVHLIGRMFEKAATFGYNYISIENSLDGFISEVVSQKTLESIYTRTADHDELEHVTLYIRKNLDCFKQTIINAGLNPVWFKDISLTVDDARDLKFANKIASMLDGSCFTSKDVLDVIAQIKRLRHV